MIITKLKGGLGNQMFQYAATISAAVDHNEPYLFDLSFFTKPKRGGLLLDKFPRTKIQTTQGNDNLPVRFDNFVFDPILKDTYLDGFWQSEKYFINNESIIRDHFDLTKSYSKYVHKKYPILAEDTISIHIRRGDYLNKPGQFPTQSLDYYSAAFETLYNNQQLIILSDDIQWCKDNFKFPNMHFISEESDIVDLYIMSICKNNIISNSSFSWWGAWLNNNSEKTVIAPKTWFGPEMLLNQSDIIPLTWTTL